MKCKLDSLIFPMYMTAFLSLNLVCKILCTQYSAKGLLLSL